MGLAGQLGVVQIRNVEVMRPPHAGNSGGPPGPASRPPANSGSAEPLRRQGRRAVGSGPRGPGHGGRRPQADGGSAGIRRAARSRQRGRAANGAGVGARGRRRAGARRSGAGAGVGWGGLRGPSGRQVPGEDPRGSRRGRRPGAGARGRGCVSSRDRLEPRFRGSRCGVCAAGAAEEPERRRCGDVRRRRRDRAVPRARGKAVLILTPNVFGESCRRGTLEGGGAEATDRLTAAGEPHSSSESKKPPSLTATSLKFRVVPGGGSYPPQQGGCVM